MTKTIVITGGSRGIGAATARLAGKRGWSVVLSYVGNEKAAKETVGAVEAAGGKAIACKCDHVIEAEVIGLFDQAARAFGAIDGVVNNAGIAAPTAALADMDIERIRKVVEVNLTGAILVARESVRRMAKSRGGRGGALVNVSSVAAKLGAPGTYVDYAAAKGGVEALTVGLSKEVGADGIRVTCVRPGVILTDIHAASGEPERPYKLGAMAPLGRPGNPEEVAAAILWLLDDESSYVTGAILDVSGGR
jgi:NAD(P)-dependent dehydrogenase (short-subunit alcohol dehydrogenase family)